MTTGIQRAWEQPSTEAWLEIGRSLLTEGEPDERQCRDIVAALSKWPEALRRVEARIEDGSDPWWRYGQLPGSLDFVRLARALTTDTRPWIELASDSRWQSGGASELRELDLRHVDKVDDITAATARASDSVGSPGILLGESGARMLNQSPALLTLRSLDLSLTDLGDRGARALADWPHSNLRTLSLHGCKLERGPLAWRGRPLLAEIEDLDLSHNHLSTRAFAAIIDSAPKLRHLIVTNSQLEPELLGRATHSCLCELDISHSVGGDWFFEVLLAAIGPSLITLIDAPLLQTLTDLDIGDNYARASDLTDLRWLAMPALQVLRLSGLRLEDALPTVFVNHAELPALRRLEIANTGCGLDGVVALIEAGWLRQLEVLDLSDNRLDGRFIDRLVAEPRGRLREVLIEGNALSPASLAQLREWLGPRG